MEVDWYQITSKDICLDPLLALLANSAEPVPLNRLALAFVESWLTNSRQPLDYRPEQSYQAGNFIRLADGRITWVRQITEGDNPSQGHFQVLTLAVSDLPRLAAGLGGVARSPSTPVDSKRDETGIDLQAREILHGAAGVYLRAIIHATLQDNSQLVSFNDEWWLAQKLPYVVTEANINAVRKYLDRQPADKGPLTPIPSAKLAALLWPVPADNPVLINLASFSLNCALARYPKEFCYLLLGGWVLAKRLPDYQVQRQPNVPRLRSQIMDEIEDEVETWPETTESASPAISTLDPWQHRDAWEHTLAKREARVRLLGQHYVEGFLSFKKNELRRVIPPSQNNVELAWFIIRRPDNTETRFSVIIDYRENVVIGGHPLRDYLASQGILPGCYLYVQRRNDAEYDIYPRLLAESAKVECKFASIDEQGRLNIEIDTIEVPYEHDARYIISETRLEDIEALWREAKLLGLSFLDILIEHIFPSLAPHGEAVHWRTIWTATFYNYRMGSQQAIWRELGRECFVPEGEGYYRLDRSKGYRFRHRPALPDPPPEETATREIVPPPSEPKIEPDVTPKEQETPTPALVIPESSLAQADVVEALSPVIPGQAANGGTQVQTHPQTTLAPARTKKRPRTVATSVAPSQLTGTKKTGQQVLSSDLTTKPPPSSLTKRLVLGAITGGLLGVCGIGFLGLLIGLLFGTFAGAVVGIIGLCGGAVIGVMVGWLAETGSAEPTASPSRRRG